MDKCALVDGKCGCPEISQYGMRRFTETGGHRWIWTAGWFCHAHQQVCDPWKPITVADLIERAAKDETLPDDVFVVLSQTLRGEQP